MTIGCLNCLCQGAEIEVSELGVIVAYLRHYSRINVVVGVVDSGNRVLEVQGYLELITSGHRPI